MVMCFPKMDKTSESSLSPLTLTGWDILCADTLRSSFSCTLQVSLISHFFAPLFSFFTVPLHPQAAHCPEMALDYSLPDSTSPSFPFASVFTPPFLLHASSSVQPLARVHHFIHCYLTHFHNSLLPSSPENAEIIIKHWRQSPNNPD